MSKVPILQFVFICFSIFFISYISLIAVTEYFNPEYSNTDKNYIEYLDKKYGNFGMNSFLMDEEK